MGSITVRRPSFVWPEDLGLMPYPDDPGRSCDLVALSFTLPYLEPYLIRTMRLAGKEIEDPELAAEMKAFSGQEAQHFQNHARINDIVRSQLTDGRAEQMRALEADLDADYRHFSATKSLAFNLAYAEGFEAMTFALARSTMGDESSTSAAPGWLDLMAWHLAEEIEHRTVTFDAYDRIVGKYPYRVAVGSRAQLHFLGYLMRMATVLRHEVGEPGVTTRRVAFDAAKRHWKSGALPGTLKALSPRYDPRNVQLSPRVRDVCALVGVDLD